MNVIFTILLGIFIFQEVFTTPEQREMFTKYIESKLQPDVCEEEK